MMGAVLSRIHVFVFLMDRFLERIILGGGFHRCVTFNRYWI